MRTSLTPITTSDFHLLEVFASSWKMLAIKKLKWLSKLGCIKINFLNYVFIYIENIFNIIEFS